jgi:formylmethanofuran dehydrogenase subunit D
MIEGGSEMEAMLSFCEPSGSYEIMMKEFLLNTGSTIEEGRLAKGGSKLTDDYTQECAVCEINPQDHRELGSPDRVLISTRDRLHSVAIFAYPHDSVAPGHVFMPRAIWCNVVVDPQTFSTGSPLYKGSPVLIESTKDEVLSAEEIVMKVYVRGRK